MARYPGAVWKPLSRNFNSGARTAQLGLILHVQAGNGELSGWFSNPSAQASSTFWVGKDGTVVQYMEAGTDKSWAQAGGNGQYDSVETEGHPTEPLTDAQVTALAALVKWEHDTYGMPYTVINTPGARGFGWHGMGGSAWGGHTGCPGDLRKAQMPQILTLARKGDAATKTTTDDLEEVITTMKATHIIFNGKGSDSTSVYIANILAGTYYHVPSPTALEQRITVLKRSGAKVAYWKDFSAAKPATNQADKIAFGTEVK